MFKRNTVYETQGQKNTEENVFCRSVSSCATIELTNSKEEEIFIKHAKQQRNIILESYEQAKVGCSDMNTRHCNLMKYSALFNRTREPRSSLIFHYSKIYSLLVECQLALAEQLRKKKICNKHETYLKQQQNHSAAGNNLQPQNKTKFISELL